MRTTGIKRISQINPTHSIVPQHPPHLPEDCHQMLDEKLNCGLQPEGSAPGAAELADVSLVDDRSQPCNPLLDGLFLISTIACVVPAPLVGVVGRVLKDR
jgi:hypothetical protein